MKSVLGIDYVKSMSDMVDSYEKLVKGVDTLMNVDYSGYDSTPKELIFHEDKMKLYHYEPKVKDPNKIPTLLVYALSLINISEHTRRNQSSRIPSSA